MHGSIKEVLNLFDDKTRYKEKLPTEDQAQKADVGEQWKGTLKSNGNRWEIRKKSKTEYFYYPDKVE